MSGCGVLGWCLFLWVCWLCVGVWVCRVSRRGGVGGLVVLCLCCVLSVCALWFSLSSWSSSAPFVFVRRGASCPSPSSSTICLSLSRVSLSPPWIPLRSLSCSVSLLVSLSPSVLVSPFFPTLQTIYRNLSQI